MTPAIRFVASAGPTIGGGHLARAMALAEADWPAGSDLELSLVEGSPSPADRERLHAAGARLAPVDAPISPGTVVVLDVPDPSPLAERWSPDGLAVFDDRESLRGRAGLVIQPSLPSWAGRAEVDAVVAGFEFAPIARAVRRRRAASLTAPLLSGPRPRLLVCFGGSDPDRLTARLVSALGDLDAEVDVVIGAGYAGPTDGWPIAPDRDPQDLVERLATADLALLGAGTMKFEAACLGRPMLLLAAADDQRPVGPAFAATGAARYLGDGRTIDPESVAEAVQTLLADRPGLEALGATAASLVDGAGADRIAAAVVRLLQPAASS
jgi:hypothetical protein